MEDILKHPFGSVRIHTDADAAASTRQLNARAYTVGEHVVFDAGELALATPAGRRLLAHELTHVVQQRSRGTALQRQPRGDTTASQTADIDVLLRDAADTVASLEAMRQQVAQVKQDLEPLIWRAEMAEMQAQLREGVESLAILEWWFKLHGKKLPTAGSAIDRTQTPFFVEGLIETSRILEPFIMGRIATTSVASNFIVYDVRSKFEEKSDELDRDVKPTVRRTAPQRVKSYGFYHRRTDTIYLPGDAKFGHALHEGVHKYSSLGVENQFGVFLNEGVTQHFTDRVQAEHGVTGSTHAYDDELQAATIVLSWINGDETMLAKAYFHGDTGPLLNEIMRRLQVDLPGLNALRADRRGRGLGERIIQVGAAPRGTTRTSP